MGAMKRAVLILTYWPLAGQWLDHPAPGVPRKADGKPDLVAPAPRAGGRPDLSGLWQLLPNPSNPQAIQSV